MTDFAILGDLPPFGKKDDVARVAFLFEKYKELVAVDTEKETPKLKK